MQELRKLRKTKKYKYIWAGFINFSEMISKQEQKYVQTLHLKKYRKEYGVFLVEGEKAIIEILQSNFEIEKVFCTKKYEEVFKKINPGVRYIVDNEENITKISTFTTNTVGVAILKQKKISLDLNLEPKVLILDGIADPGNLGTIIRLADWYGLKNIICSLDCAEFYNPKVIASTMGSFMRINVHYLALDDFLKNYKKPILGAYLNGESVHSFQKLEEFALIIGSESHGISDKVGKLITNKITIPKRGHAESLNAGVACGIILDRIF